MAKRAQKIKQLEKYGLIPPVSKRRRTKNFRKKTDYGLRLDEKQKLKFKYGISERQLKRYIREASRESGPVGETILKKLETRLDNVIYHLGMALTRPQARQLVNHAHVAVNGETENIPSRNLAPGDAITVKEKPFLRLIREDNLKNKKSGDIPAWLVLKGEEGKIVRWPEREELPKDVDISSVLAFYR